MFRSANFAHALAIARGHFGAGANIDLVRLAPGDLQLFVIAGGHRQVVRILANGDYMTIDTGPAISAQPVFHIAQLQPSVPGVLAHRIAVFGHVPQSQLDYMVAEIEPVLNVFRWLIYPVGGGVVHFEAATATSPIMKYGPGGVTTLAG
jgi:hypothetical protein